MSIREVTLTDLETPGCLDSLVHLGKLIYKRSGYRGIEFDPNNLRSEIYEAVVDPDTLILISERDNKIIGGMIATISTIYFSKAKQSMDDIVFIHPDYKNTLDGPRLISKYVKWAKSNNVTHINFTQTLGWSGREKQEESEKMGKFLRRRFGFNQAGVIYRLNNDEVKTRGPI